MLKTKIFLWLLSPMLFILGFFVFGSVFWFSQVYAKTFFNCSCDVIEGGSLDLPDLPQGAKYDEDGEEQTIENRADAEIAYGNDIDSGVFKCKENSQKCIEEEYPKADACDPNGTSSECPSGYKCGAATDYSTDPMGTTKNTCLMISNCKVDSDCGGKQTCDKNTGLCFMSTTETEGCICAQNISCNSPMCSKDKDSLNTGLCVGGYCQKTSSLSQGGCASDKECWDKGIAVCCISGQCTGPINQCKDNSCSSAGATDDTNACPPGYLCDTDFQVCRKKQCPVQPNESCDTDENCKEHANGKCAEITSGSFATDGAENTNICKSEGTVKKCTYSATSESVGPGLTQPTSVDFSWWPAKGRLQTLLGAKIIPWIMGIVGLLCVVIIIIGGFSYLQSGGNEQKVEAAKKMISGAVIGLFFTLVAYIAVEMVIGIFTQ